MQRKPEDLVHGEHGPVVIVTARVCAYLNRYAGLDEFRRANRGADAEVDAVLVAFTVVGARWRESATGQQQAAEPDPASDSKWVSTATAANRLGITDRSVRRAISQGRMHATNVEGRWRISPEDLHHYRAKQGAA